MPKGVKATTYTKAELNEFDMITAQLSSPNQMERITARVLLVPKFVEKHGQTKCDEMFEELKRRDRGKR